MKTPIEVANRREAELIRNGLSDPTVRALVKVCGALSVLPSDRARGRVLWHVSDYLDEQTKRAAAPNVLEPPPEKETA